MILKHLAFFCFSAGSSPHAFFHFSLQIKIGPVGISKAEACNVVLFQQKENNRKAFGFFEDHIPAQRNREKRGKETRAELYC